MMLYALITALIVALTCSQLVPTGEILLFPNTQDSPSLYMISFKTGVTMDPGEYLLLNMDWLNLAISPHSCILVNTTKTVKCSNLNTLTITLTFQTAAILKQNSQIDLTRTLVVQLTDGLTANTAYYLQIALRNVVDNLAKISPSMEIYLVNKDGLIYEENTNFGAIVYKPPITNLLSVSVINDLSSNVPGSLSTLKAQVTISVPVQTSLSAMIFILKHPFQFSTSSYLLVDESENYATNPIPLYMRPRIVSYEVKSPHVFYAVFNESFAAGRKFIVKINEITNPFFIATSNISIYSTNFNSLTPLEGYESLYPLATVMQPLTINLGLPYDMPMQGPCVFYRYNYNFYKISFNMPKSVPEGYAIKVIASDHTISQGSAYVNFQSLNYTTVYEYSTSNWFSMKKMGPIDEGSLISITFKAYKNSLTNFDVKVYIDTEAVIKASTAARYMFEGRADAQSVDSDDFYNDAYTSPNFEFQRFVQLTGASQYLRILIYPRVPTSAGSYIEMYFSPQVTFDPLFNPNSDCRFNNTASSAICTVTRTSNYVHIIMKSTSSYEASVPNFFIQNTYCYLYLYRIRFPRPSSNKYMYQTYFRLFNSSAVNPTTYIEQATFNVLPKQAVISGFSLEQHGNIFNLGYNYSGFLRFESTNPSVMNYTLQQNEVRVISMLSRYGTRGFSTLSNQDPYPCASNIAVTCIYRVGNPNLYYQMNEWESIDIFFKPGSTETTQNFQVIAPDSIVTASGNYYNFMMGKYNLLTKDYFYMYRGSSYYRGGNWWNSPNNLQAGMLVDFEGKAGSYRKNVTITVENYMPTGNHNFLVINSAWSLFESGTSAYTSATLALTNPKFYTGHLSPLSVYMANGMYMTIIPFTCTSAINTFKMWINNLHMPYHYDLPNYYIYLLTSSSNEMQSYNSFEMTNQNIFYETNLKSLSVSCLENFLGIKNTKCQITFGTQNPLKADGVIKIVFSGMNVATSVCSLTLPNGTKVATTCSSTENNKNVSITLTNIYGAYHYPADNFTVSVSGVSIEADQISQSLTLYLLDSSGKYVIEKGTRILTTTVARPEDIEIYEIIYSYLSPLSANKMSITFYLPRTIYDDERLGFIMGKDLSDVNQQIKRLRIVLTRGDGVVISSVHQLISEEYKVLFTFKDSSQVIESNYTMQIFGIMTPASHQNGAFSIIYQRKFDKAFTLTNKIQTSFPAFVNKISSNISIKAYYNTEGYEQKLEISIINTNDVINDEMVWIVNFPSYYSESLFNYNAYCMIDTAPIECFPDPTTPYQLVVRNSPKIISTNTLYKISIHRIACPRAIYTNNYYLSRYLFIGVLKTKDSEAYVETSLLYPEQTIKKFINGELVIVDMTVTTLSQPTFSSIYANLYLKANVNILANSVLFLIFPLEFDNFNNNPINIVIKKSNGVLLWTGEAPVIDRKLEIAIPSLILANDQFLISFPSLPTPKLPCSVSMSKIIGFVTYSNLSQIYIASSKLGNSAPIFNFVEDTRYISFNHDQTISITAGTYSSMIDITSSDGEQFLTNIIVNLTSTGFVFEPASIFLKLGDEKGQFRVGADSGLLPISYFYSSVKSEENLVYYTITKNNNIRITNTPVQVVIPSSITVPLGGCSEPYIVDILNPPIDDVGVSFTYDNAKYEQKLFWVNHRTTKSELSYNSNVTKNAVSFCSSSTFSTAGLPSTFPMTFVFIGTNYHSYEFTPSKTVSINIVAIPVPSLPPIASIEVINIQKTFIDFNITINMDGIVYYYLNVGQDQTPLNEVDLKIYLKNNVYILQSMKDFINERVYTTERDQRVGMLVKNAGEFTLRIDNLLPERYYTFCVYLENRFNTITTAKCRSVSTQSWGVIMKAKVEFTSALTAVNLNKILCFFAKQVDTQVTYILDLQSNSCYNREVSNLYYNYSGQTFSAQNKHTIIYMITNPSITSDPSPTAFQSMYGTNKQLTSAALTSATSGFAINYLSSTYITSDNAIGMISINQANKLSASFDSPAFNSKTKKITINNVMISGGHGTVYFLLVLYKEIYLNGNKSYVNIRLNVDPTPQQILNCENWEGKPAEGCARSTYSYSAQTVVFENVHQNCMYLLYYAVASEYPLRPIISSTVKNESIVTFNFGSFAQLSWAIIIVLSLVLA